MASPKLERRVGSAIELVVANGNSFYPVGLSRRDNPPAISGHSLNQTGHKPATKRPPKAAKS